MRRNVDGLVDTFLEVGEGRGGVVRTATVRVALAARSSGMEPPRLLRVLKRVSPDPALRHQISELAIDAYYGQAD